MSTKHKKKREGQWGRTEDHTYFTIQNKNRNIQSRLTASTSNKFINVLEELHSFNIDVSEEATSNEEFNFYHVLVFT